MPGSRAREKTMTNHTGKVKEQVVAALGPGLFLSWSAQLVIGQTTVRLVQHHSRNGAAASTLTSLTSVCALSQFFLNRPLGALSERYGRKPLILGISLLALIVRGFTAYRPYSWAVLVCDRILGKFSYRSLSVL